jgi:ABC-2 type transport system permease protein
VLVTAVGVLAIALVLLTLFSLAIAAAAALRGSTVLPAAWFGEVVRSILRVAAVCAGASMIGAAVAMIGRNTAAALGAVFVYMTVFEGVLRGLRPSLARFFLGTNIAAVIANTRIEIYDGFAKSYFVSPRHGDVTLVVYVVVLIAVAGLLLRARDVN